MASTDPPRLTLRSMWRFLLANPQSKRASLRFAVVMLALLLPYLGYALYLSSRYSSGQIPSSLLYALLAWFLAIFFVGMPLARRALRVDGQPIAVDPEMTRALVAQSVRRMTWRLRLWAALLVVVVVGMLAGIFPLKRAIPASAFLAILIGYFARAMRQAKNAQAQNETRDRVL